MERLTGMDNAVVRISMALVLKGYIENFGEIQFTNGDRIFIGEDDKLKMAAYSDTYERQVIKKWGKIKFDKRQTILKELSINKTLVKSVSEMLDEPSAVILNYTKEDSKKNRNILAKVVKKYLQENENSIEDNSNIFIGVEGKLRVISDGITRKWGKVSFDKRVKLINKLVNTNLQFIKESNNAIVDVVGYAMEDLYEDTRYNRNKVAKILKNYLSSDDVELVYLDGVTEIIVVDGKLRVVNLISNTAWGKIRWETRVRILKEMKLDTQFVASISK